MKNGLVAALLAVVLALPLPAAAQFIHELRGGVLAHDIPIVAAGRYETGIGLNAEIAFSPYVSLLGGTIRPALGGTFASQGGTSWIYLEAKWEWTIDRLFLGIGLGPAIHNGELQYVNGRKGLGSRVLFHVPLEVGFQITDKARLSVYYEHVSNGFLVWPNPGMDNIGGRLAWRF